MKKNALGIMSLLLISLFLMQSSASADEQSVFFGVNYSIQAYKSDSLDATYTPTVALMRLGVDVNDNLGFEARYGFSVTNDTQLESNKTLELTNTAMLGLYAKPRFMLTSTAGIYGLVGANLYDLNLRNNTNLASQFVRDSSSVSVGAGLESRLLKNWLLSAEFLVYAINSDELFSGLEFGGAYLF